MAKDEAGHHDYSIYLLVAAAVGPRRLEELAGVGGEEVVSILFRYLDPEGESTIGFAATKEEWHRILQELLKQPDEGRKNDRPTPRP